MITASTPPIEDYSISVSHVPQRSSNVKDRCTSFLACRSVEHLLVHACLMNRLFGRKPILHLDHLPRRLLQQTPAPTCRSSIQLQQGGIYLQNPTSCALSAQLANPRSCLPDYLIIPPHDCCDVRQERLVFPSQ